MSGIAGVFSLGAESEEEVGTHGQPARFQYRQDIFARGAGIGSTLQYDELPRSQLVGNGVGRVYDISEVGFAAIGQRCRHANKDRIRLVEAVEPIGGFKAFLAHAANGFAGELIDVTLAALEHLDFTRIDVEADDRESVIGKSPCERQADVT